MIMKTKTIKSMKPKVDPFEKINKIEKSLIEKKYKLPNLGGKVKMLSQSKRMIREYHKQFCVCQLDNLGKTNI